MSSTESHVAYDVFTARWGDTVSNDGYDRVYEQWASTYDNEHPWIVQQFGKLWLDHLSQNGLSAGHNILDMGCGTGLSTRSIAAVCPEAQIVGLDKSPAMLQAYVYGAAVVRADGHDIPLADNSFDTLVCSLSLSNFDNPEVAVREFERVVRPGGIISIFESPRDPRALVAFHALGAIGAVDTIVADTVECRKNHSLEGIIPFSMALKSVVLET